MTVRTPRLAEKLAARATESKLNLRVIDEDHIGVSFDETTGREELSSLWCIFAGQAKTTLDVDALDSQLAECIPKGLIRRSAFMNHPVFNSYHSETEMMRYLRRLANRDIALDRGMIPLG